MVTSCAPLTRPCLRPCPSLRPAHDTLDGLRQGLVSVLLFRSFNSNEPERAKRAGKTREFAHFPKVPRASCKYHARNSTSICERDFEPFSSVFRTIFREKPGSLQFARANVCAAMRTRSTKLERMRKRGGRHAWRELGCSSFPRAIAIPLI